VELKKTLGKKRGWTWDQLRRSRVRASESKKNPREARGLRKTKGKNPKATERT